MPKTNCVFILGCPRSGTSVLAWALAEHPEFWTSSESDFLQSLFGKGALRRAYAQAAGRPDHGWLEMEGVAYEEFAGAIGWGIDRLFSSRSGGLRWVDATPGYLMMADELAVLFPRAQFVHIVRDGRAVVSSMLHSGFDVPWAHDPEQACRTWVDFVTAGLELEARHPKRTLRVTHESLGRDTAGTMREIFRFLKAPYHAAPAEFLRTHRINSSYGNNCPLEVSRKKDPGVIPMAPWSDWPDGLRELFERIAGPIMSACGYGPARAMDHAVAAAGSGSAAVIGVAGGAGV